METKLVFIERAKALRAPILFADQTYRVTDQRFLPDSQRLGIESLLDGNRFEVECDLQGIYQRLNVPTALTVLDVLNGSGGLRIAPQDVRRGFASAARATGLRGRWERAGRAAVCRLRHGTQRVGIAEVAAQIARQTYRKLYMVVGFVEDKDLSRVLPAASPAGALRLHEGRDPPRARRARARAPGRRLRIAGRVRPDRERGARAGPGACRTGRYDFHRGKHLCRGRGVVDR